MSNLQFQIIELEPILATRSLSKSFKDFKAVQQLTFSIDKGDIYGFLGQNGAGKSTTMRMLLGLIYPDEGEIFIEGQLFNNQNRHLLAKIGAIIERPDMYGYLTGWENLRMFATLSDPSIKNSRLEEVLEIVGLRDRAKDKVKAYSMGMKQRLGIAIALVHKPELLILDEPTNGLDPQGIAEMRHLILSLSKDLNKTILISSHLLFEIEQIATRMIIMHKGKKIVEGQVEELLNPNETLVEVHFKHPIELTTLLNNTTWLSLLHQTSPFVAVFKMNPSETPMLNKTLVERGAEIMEIKSKHSLETYFLTLTNDTSVKN